MNGTPLLSNEEQRAMELTSDLSNVLRDIIKPGDSPANAGDWAEAAHEIHALQHRIMSQAAARAYPGRFRLMGGRS